MKLPQSTRDKIYNGVTLLCDEYVYYSILLRAGMDIFDFLLNH